MSLPGKTFGKYWAAVDGNLVTGLILIPMINKEDPKYLAFRDKAKETLQLLGDVVTGEIQELNGQRVFVKRITHSNRSKHPTEPREAKQYQLPPHLR